jgi:hypothetical protein
MQHEVLLGQSSLVYFNLFKLKMKKKQSLSASTVRSFAVLEESTEHDTTTMSDNDKNNITAQPNLPLDNWREQRQERQVWKPIHDELIRNLPSQLSEDDIRYILSVPAERRTRLYQVDDPEVVFRYIPREYSGYSISYEKARSVLDYTMISVLSKRLRGIDGFVSLSLFLYSSFLPHPVLES